MDCSINNRQKTIENYLEGKLSQLEQNEFEEHIFNCDLCFQELRLQEEIRHLVKHEGNELFARYLEKKRKYKPNIWEQISEKLSFIFIRSPYRLAYASIVVCLVLLCIIIIIPSGPSIDPEHFTESSYFEDLMSTRFRSSYSFEIESPRNGMNIEDDVEFKWETDYEGLLFINIFNNKEEQVMSFTVDNNQLLIKDLDEKLQPGLYYWKLESERSIFFIGKFFILKPSN